MKFSIALLLTTSLAAVFGCYPSESTTVKTFAEANNYLLAIEPSDAMHVGEARKKIKHDDDITLVGRIGGSSDPFVDGMAAFTIVDEKIPFCSADEGCPTPWDYCCQTSQVKENIAVVQLVDDHGKPLMKDARQLFDVKGLSQVTVQGKAKRDEHGNLVVDATKLFVSSKK